MDNETVFAYKEKIAVTESGIATVTAVITDNWSQWTWDDAIIKFFGNSTAGSSNSDIDVKPTSPSTNSTLQNFFNTINDWNIFGTNLIFLKIISESYFFGFNLNFLTGQFYSSLFVLVSCKICW